MMNNMSHPRKMIHMLHLPNTDRDTKEEGEEEEVEGTQEEDTGTQEVAIEVPIEVTLEEVEAGEDPLHLLLKVVIPLILNQKNSNLLKESSMETMKEEIW